MDYWRGFQPAPDIGLAEYSIRNIFNEEGRPFDHLAFPHSVACGGPMDAFDSMTIREMIMQYGSRLAKTFTVLCATIYTSDLTPCNQILAGHVEDLGLQQTERVRQMGLQVPALASTQLGKKTLKKRLRFNGNTVYAAWARSPGTLSNINARQGAASELDLWEDISTSRHPDPEDMFGDRFKDNDSSRKVWYESIPTLQGTYEDKNGNERPRSRIEARRLRGSDCRFVVCCVLCGGPQVLVPERLRPLGYQCEHCEKLIADEHRKPFVRTGVWCPRGCDVDPEKSVAAAELRLDLLSRVAELKEGDPELADLRRQLEWHGWSNCDYLIGEPDNDGDKASYQLSSLYALSLTWERLHEECIDEDGQPKWKSQNIVNQWFAETFEVEEEEEFDIEAEAASLATTITGQLTRNTIPDWAEFLILTCDRQDGTFPWKITAWDKAIERVLIVDSGEVVAFAEVEKILQRAWGSRQLSLVLMDSGYLAFETYDWCLRMTKKHKLRVWPVKGDKESVVKHNFKPFPIEDEKGRKAKYRKIKRIHVNTQSTQEWVRKLLRDRKQIQLSKDNPAAHQRLCEQLLNEIETVKQSSKTWNRITSSKPNDQRDNLRYGFVGAQLARSLKVNRRQAMSLPNQPTTEQDIRPVGPAKRPVLKLL